ncbi:MAG: hypothetical protein VYA58_06090 [Pseudomonadota bacterium]|nr:hypothetical protein [Pseudomonadota bacterium]
MTESSEPRGQTTAHYAPALQNITLVITVVSGVGMTTKWLDPVVSFALWCLGYSIAVVGAHFRQNRRNVLLFTFLALNMGYGAINWM